MTCLNIATSGIRQWDHILNFTKKILTSLACHVIVTSSTPYIMFILGPHFSFLFFLLPAETSVSWQSNTNSNPKGLPKFSQNEA